jgi:hypothetical protein
LRYPVRNPSYLLAKDYNIDSSFLNSELYGLARFDMLAERFESSLNFSAWTGKSLDLLRTSSNKVLRV